MAAPFRGSKISDGKDHSISSTPASNNRSTILSLHDLTTVIEHVGQENEYSEWSLSMHTRTRSCCSFNIFSPQVEHFALILAILSLLCGPRSCSNRQELWGLNGLFDLGWVFEIFRSRTKFGFS